MTYEATHEMEWLLLDGSSEALCLSNVESQITHIF